MLRALAVVMTLSSPPGDPLAALETRAECRLGVAAVDTATGARLTHRGDERFLMCSTFKLLLGGHILNLVDAGKQDLSTNVTYTKADLLEYAPISASHVRGGMTVDALCAAAIQYSDNTAANLLFGIQGGPAGLTLFLRSIGDRVTRSDRIEPLLNARGEPRELDTTSPAAMAQSVQHLLLGDALSVNARKRLEQWAKGNTTGNARLRAGVPGSWAVADKTGTGEQGNFGDVGVIYPPDRPPIVIAAFLDGCTQPRATCEAMLADVAKIVVAWSREQAATPKTGTGPR